jgi:hypothetical protein
MDQIPLVSQQIDDGKRLIAGLLEEGIPVTGAFWVKESEGGWWYLYIATLLVGRSGATLPAYARINRVIRQMPQPFGIDTSEVKAVAPSDPIAEAALALQERHPGNRGFFFEGSQLGGKYIEAAYIYPPVNALAVP